MDNYHHVDCCARCRFSYTEDANHIYCMRAEILDEELHWGDDFYEPGYFPSPPVSSCGICDSYEAGEQ